VKAFLNLSRPSGSSTIAEDALQCLRSLSSSTAGAQYLLKYHSLVPLLKAYLLQNRGTSDALLYVLQHFILPAFCAPVSEEAKDVLLSVLQSVCTEVLEEPCRAAVVPVLSFLAEEFRTNQVCTEMSEHFLCHWNAATSAG